jgi:hypothetical protein
MKYQLKFRLKNSQRIRVIIDTVALYMTVGEARRMWGYTSNHQAVDETLRAIENNNRDHFKKPITGLGWNTHGHQVQVDLV